MRKVSAKRNPLLQGELPLDFEGENKEDYSKLTEKQEADRFMSKWLEVMHPFTKYKRYFEETDKDADRVLKEIKNNYMKHVVRGSWPERKFVVIVDSILVSKFSFTPKVFEGREKLFEEGRLEAQLLEKRLNRRKRI